MDLSAELRYYEIRFTRIVTQFFRVYKLDKLLTFMEMAAFISEADLQHIKNAMQKVLANDTRVRVGREEYIVCLKLFSGLNNTELRKTVACSPNTIITLMEDYKNNDIYIHPKFELVESDNIRKLVKGLTDVINIY